MEHLSRELNETVDLGVLDGMHVLFIAQHPAPQRSLMVVSRVGARFPAWCTANGKALLAELPADDIEAPAAEAARDSRHAHAGQPQGPVRRAPGSALDGLAFDREEHHAGICGVGVAVRDIDGGLASISVPMPAARFHEDPDTVVAALLRVRDEVNIALKSG